MVDDTSLCVPYYWGGSLIVSQINFQLAVIWHFILAVKTVKDGKKEKACDLEIAFLHSLKTQCSKNLDRDTMTFAKLQCSKEIEETVIKTNTGTWILAGSPAVPSSVFEIIVFLASVFKCTAQSLLSYPYKFWRKRKKIYKIKIEQNIANL